MAGLPPRYSTRPFPAYAFRPGRNPHPTRDPQGHSRARAQDTAPAFDPARWGESGEYLFGVDLFNHAYWWEAHEAWEACWIAAGRDTVAGQFLQGLIQAAAACLKRELGQANGARLL